MINPKFRKGYIDAERFAYTLLILALVMVVAMFLLTASQQGAMTRECAPYRDTPLRDVPAKCINSRGGTY